MPKEIIRSELESLRAQIDRSGSISESTQQQAHETFSMLDQLLLQGDMEEEIEAAGGSLSIVDQLKDLATEFEADHPKLASGIEHVLELLGKIGI